MNNGTIGAMATKKTSYSLSDQDTRRVDVVAEANSVTKSGAVRYALAVAELLSTGKARLVDDEGKPITVIATG